MKNKRLQEVLSKLPSDATVDIIEPDGTYYSRIFKIRYTEEKGHGNRPELKKVHLSLEPVWQGEEHINVDDVWINKDIKVPPHCYTCTKYNHLKNKCSDGRIMDPKCKFYTSIEGDCL